MFLTTVVTVAGVEKEGARATWRRTADDFLQIWPALTAISVNEKLASGRRWKSWQVGGDERVSNWEEREKKEKKMMLTKAVNPVRNKYSKWREESDHRTYLTCSC
jgi:hypothetical protein